MILHDLADTSPVYLFCSRVMGALGFERPFWSPSTAIADLHAILGGILRTVILRVLVHVCISRSWLSEGCSQVFACCTRRQPLMREHDLPKVPPKAVAVLPGRHLVSRRHAASWPAPLEWQQPPERAQLL